MGIYDEDNVSCNSVYVPLRDINELQTDIMLFIEYWVHVEKTPIPLKEIIKDMKIKGVKEYTAVNAINALLHKGYIRRAVVTSNKTYYVQCKGI